MRLNTDISCIKSTDKIIVANNRQMLVFQQQYLQQYKAIKLPKIFRTQTLLLDFWVKSNTYKNNRLIENGEISYIWGKILKNNKIRVTANIINQIITNYTNLQNQQIPLAEIAQNELSMQFVGWIKQYKNFKKENSLFDIYDVFDAVKDLDLSQKYYIFGFKAFTKVQQILFNKLQITTLQPKSIVSDLVDKTFNNLDDEIYACGVWAKTLQQQDKTKTIVIVCAELDRHYLKIETMFNQIFDNNFTQTKNKLFNISLGKPLNHYSIIQNLLLVLNVSKQIIDNNIIVNDLTALITCKYIANAKNEKNNRAIIASKLLNLTKNNLTYKDIKELLGQDLNLIINNLRKLKLSYSSHSSWIKIFEKILHFWGFASDRLLTSDEYQIFNKFSKAILLFNKFSYLSTATNFSQAYNDLNNNLNNEIFQPQSGKHQVHIIGGLEAEGLNFDHAWVIGLNANVLPQTIKKSNYIPANIAKAYKVPRSNYKLIMRDSQSSIQAFSQLANKVIISYAQNVYDIIQEPSTMLNWNNKIISINKKYESKALTTVKNDVAKKLVNFEIKKGVKTLEHQMSCAFRGFAHRLNITDTITESAGLSTIDKGIITHKILELLYQQITSKQVLDTLTSNDIDVIIAEKTTIAMQNFVGNLFYDIEFSRFTNIITNFIELEKNRNSWFVQSLEASHKIKISKLKFAIKADRIDKNSNGEKIVFDYKTGDTHLKDWCGERIKDPQLPIYAISENVSAIAFIDIKTNAIIYKGMAENNEVLPTKKSDCCDQNNWQQQLQIWQQSLESFADDFINGLAEILPEKTSCKYCNLANLCRIENV